MAFIQTRSSVLAVVQESTEGTVVAPSAGTDAIALQPDFSMEPGFDTLTNDELRGSIGAVKPIQGAENPTASGSHYLRHSGVEGTAPNFHELLVSCFGGSSTAGAEYDTVASSTVSVIKVNTGEGATFERGELLLIKDGTNGYSIRGINSISGDNLTINFNVANAPAAAVNLGKCVLYKPANASHPTVSVWHYLANGGALQLMAGGRVTSLGLDVSAGELLNMSYNIEGLSYYFNPITIASADRYIDWEDDDGVHAATVAAQVYKDPHALADALQEAMNAQTSETITVTYSNTTGKYTIAATGALFELQWNTGSNTANTIGDKIGFSTAADDTSALTYTSDNAVSFAFAYTPSYDTANPLVAKYHQIMIGDATDYVTFDASSVNFSIENTRAPINNICAESGRSGSLFTERAVTAEVTAYLTQYDADKFRRFRAGTDTKFQYSFGTKTGGNWDAGKSGAIWFPTGTISAFSIADEDGLAVVNFTVTACVDTSGNPEAYLGFV